MSVNAKAVKTLSRYLDTRISPYALAVLLGVCVYLRSINGPFIWDDQVLVQQFRGDGHGGLLSVFLSGFLPRVEVPGTDFYRPMVALSYILDFRLWGDRTMGYHLANLALHAGCILGVAWLAALILRSRAASIAAAFLFAVHPAHSHSVAWISGRTDLLCAVFLLPALCTYMLYRAGRKKSVLALSLLLTLFALMSKELALIAPVLVALAAWVDGERSYRRVFLHALPYLVVAGAFYLLRGMIVHAGPVPFDVPFKARLFVIGRSVWIHLLMLVLPNTARLGYDLTRQQIMSSSTVVAILVVAILTISLWAIRRRSRVPLFAMAWFLATIIPVSGVPGSYTTGMISERFLYLPSVGLAIAFGRPIMQARHSRSTAIRSVGVGMGIALIMWLSVLSMNRSALYTSVTGFWDRYVADAPRNPSGYFNRGIAYMDECDYEESARNLEVTVSMLPRSAQARYALGQARLQLGEYDEAIRCFRQALRLSPGDKATEDALAIAEQAKAIDTMPRR